MQRNLRFGPLEALLLREGRARQTIKSYGSAVKQLQVWWEKPLPETKREDLSAYLTYCTKERGYSRSTMKQVVNAIRAFYERVLDFE
jgi:site-specific recombinase XerD